MLHDTLKFIELGELSEADREQLKKKLREQKKYHQAAIRNVNQGLKKLAKKPRRKKGAKRKARKRRS
jgi:hypothetical protein